MPVDKIQRAQLKKLGQRLKKIRLEKGLTLKELGFKINKDPQSISRVEQGDINPTYLYLLTLTEGLEISLEELIMRL
jgi:transcriptional regulator with XRE-family HTH domain